MSDTILDGCKTDSMTSRLNLRIIINGKKKLDCCNGEFARRAATNESKLYYDNSKATLAAKCHLNHIITTAPHLTPKNYTNDHYLNYSDHGLELPRLLFISC